MSLAKTIVILACLSVIVHVIDAGGWAHLGAAPLSGGDPAPCAGGVKKVMCTPKTGHFCTDGFDEFDGTATTKTRTKDVTATGCTTNPTACVAQDYSQSKVGCLQP